MSSREPSSSEKHTTTRESVYMSIDHDQWQSHGVKRGFNPHF